MSTENGTIRKLLTESDVILVVGLSTVFRKDSRIVAAHMQREGYRIIPVHPNAEELLGEVVYPSISALSTDLAAEVDIVNVFRPADEVPDIVEEALEYLPNLKAIWTQKGIVHDGAAEHVRDAGIEIIQDRCIRTQQLFLKFGS